jgi:hypothetical protein
MPTAVPRRADVMVGPPSQPGNGLFSSGRSATKSTATTPIMMKSCSKLTARKSG